MQKQFAVPLIVAVALFVQQIDSTALATALPTIGEVMGETPVRAHLVLTSYMFGLAAFIPLSSWLADRFGAKRVFVAAIAIFTGASLLCGATSSFEMLIGSRILQALGGAMLTPVGRLILIRSVEKQELVKAFALMSMPVLVAPVVGPLVGGVLTSFASWRWLFWVNLPIGLIGMILVSKLIPNVRETIERRFDPVGTLLCSLGLSTLLFGLDTAASAERPELFSLGSIAFGLATSGAFVMHARRRDHPAVDLTLFRVPTFRASMTGGSLFRIGADAMPFLLPLFFQIGFGYSPIQSALVTFVAAIGALGIRTLGFRLLRHFGFRSVLCLGTAFTAACIAGCAAFRPGFAMPAILGILFAFGVGRSLTVMATNTLAFADLAPAQLSDGTSLYTIMQRISASVGIAAAAALLHRLAGPAGVPIWAFGVVFVSGGVVVWSSALIFRNLDEAAGAELAGRVHKAQPGA